MTQIGDKGRTWDGLRATWNGTRWVPDAWNRGLRKREYGIKVGRWFIGIVRWVQS